MQKTVSINLGGFVFNIEELAYQKLNHYLLAIKKNLGSSDETTEIINDVEARIAELFKARNINKEVITESDVNYIIETMGKPEDYVTEDSKSEPNTSSSTSFDNSKNSNNKRLYRDTENATLAGVCSGLSHYFDLDVTIIRVCLVLFTLFGFGTGVLIYIVLAFVAPEAKTTAEKLQMKGQSVNLDSIKEHFYKLKNEITENAQKSKLQKWFKESILNSKTPIALFVRFVLSTIGIAFLFTSIVLFTLIFTLFFNNNAFLSLDHENPINIYNLISVVSFNDDLNWLFTTAIITLILVPALSIFFTGLKLVFNYKASLKKLGLILSICWFIALGITIYFGTNVATNCISENKISRSQKVVPDSAKTFTIDVITNHNEENGDFTTFSDFVKFEQDSIKLGYPYLNIGETSDSTKVEIEIVKVSKGASPKDASLKALSISYDYKLTNNKLLLNEFFKIVKKAKFRAQRVYVNVYLPKNIKVELGKNIKRINYNYYGGLHYKNPPFGKENWQQRSKRHFYKEMY